MKKKITFKQIESKVRRLIKKSPRTKYKSPGDDFDPDYKPCFYTEGKCTNGSTGCIFGQALCSLGVDKGELENLEQKSIDFVLNRLGIKVSPAEGNWAINLQEGQDRQCTWNQALKTADIVRKENKV